MEEWDSELNGLHEKNGDLDLQVQTLESEKKQLQGELDKVREQLSSQNALAPDEELAALKEELKTRLLQVSREERTVQAEKEQWRERLTTAEHEVRVANDKLLQEKNAVRELSRELTQVREQLSTQTAPQQSKIVDLPDAATLLNQLKSDRKKSRADLADVEAILELLPEMPAQQPQLPDLYAARDKLFEIPYY